MIAIGIGGGVHLGAFCAHHTLNVVACGHAVGIQIAGCGEQVFEFYPFIAADAGHGCCTAKIAVCKFINNGIFKNVLIIEDIMREAHLFGNAARVVDIDPRTASARLGQSCAVIIELKRDADYVIAFFGQHSCDNRAINAA